MEKRFITILIIIGALGILASQSLFTVSQTERAIVLQLGEPMRSISTPGLNLKLPFVQNIIYLDKRILSFDATRASAYTSDNKNIVLDNFTRWRIKDTDTKNESDYRQDNCLRYYQTLNTVAKAQARLGDLVNSELRVVIGRYTLTEVITSKRQVIMDEVIKKANELSAEYGIEIVDVRIKRADLPDANQKAVFDRMKAERIRLATQYRSEGDEEAIKVRSSADLEQTRLLSEARNEAQKIKGEGDAIAIKSFADALSTAPEFYEFARTLETYKKSFKDNTRLIIPLGSDYLKYLK
ncbi:MAG: protease modulator HflC [Deltaproteobacteria bacterium]|jgi:membrane protease subunit HflC|nr:protease modulator HflC [Deltaproteobacteria bacterium]